MSEDKDNNNIEDNNIDNEDDKDQKDNKNNDEEEKIKEKFKDSIEPLKVVIKNHAMIMNSVKLLKQNSKYLHNMQNSINSMKLFKSSYKPSVELSNTMKAVFKEYNTMKEIQTMAKSMVEFQNSNIIKAARTMSNMLKSNLNFGKTIQNMLKDIYVEGGIFDRFAVAMISVNWTPVTDISISMMKSIIEIFDSKELEEAEKEIGELLLAHYTEDVLIEILESWSDKRYLRRRMPILTEVIEAHINGKYNVAIPALLPQIEGVIADANHHKGQMQGKHIEGYVKKIVEDVKHRHFDDILVHFITEIVLVSFRHGQPITSSLSRHAILHGADTSYGSKKNSLKAILTFDYLQSLYKLVSIKGSKVYHKVGCGKLTHKKGDIHFYKSSREAEANGKHACKVCKPE